tara:strand:- start:74 stop:478 length:405 start_codon:yes stop_codon:yes gene_type:complete
MASQLKVDKFTGLTTAGSIVVTGEGNSTTTNLQQGLAKVWCNADQNGNRSDSFNVGSVTDNGTGDVTYNFSNAMSNAVYSFVGACSRDSASTNEGFVFSIHSQATGSARARHLYHGQTAYDHDIMNTAIHGDLA